jgi:hypothetical protein
MSKQMTAAGIPFERISGFNALEGAKKDPDLSKGMSCMHANEV